MTKRLIHTTAGPVQMVPAEATKRMSNAWWHVHFRDASQPGGNGDVAAFKEAFAAAPASPQADVVALYEALEIAETALVDLGACDDPACSEPNCLHALTRVRTVLSSFKVEEDDA